MEDMRELFEETARTLAKRPCLVFFNPPPTKGVKGESYMEGETLVIIDIHPAQSWSDRLIVLLHETAHAMKHFPQRLREPLPIDRFIPASIIMTPEEMEYHQVDPAEDEANRQAAKWAAWADRAAAPHLQDWMPEELKVQIKLICLKGYRE